MEKKFSLDYISIGDNYVSAVISGENGEDIDLEIIEVPKELIKKTFEVYGVTLSDEDLINYQY